MTSAATARYQRVRHVIPPIEWAVFEPDIEAILELKRQRGALILAHNYQTPEIFHGVADIVGDSLTLAREAARAEADILVVCGVHFMAETAKLLNPARTVLVPDPAAGCSLADAITADDVLALRARHPGVPVVTYVNSSAAGKDAARCMNGSPATISATCARITPVSSCWPIPNAPPRWWRRRTMPGRPRPWQPMSPTADLPASH